MTPRSLVATLLVSLPAALAGVSATVFSSDLTSGPGLDNIKATWDTDLTIGGSKTALSVLYDLKAKKDSIKEAKLSGAVSDVGYALTYAVDKSVAGLTLTCKKMSHTLKAVGNSASKLTLVSAKGSASVGGCEISYEPAYLVSKKASKLTLSAALFGGISASSAITVTNSGAISSDVDLEYETSVSEGRTLSVAVDPKAMSGSVALTDTATEPGATWVASMDIASDSRPGLKLRRSVKF